MKRNIILTSVLLMIGVFVGLFTYLLLMKLFAKIIAIVCFLWLIGICVYGVIAFCRESREGQIGIILGPIVIVCVVIVKLVISHAG